MGAPVSCFCQRAFLEVSAHLRVDSGEISPNLAAMARYPFPIRILDTPGARVQLRPALESLTSTAADRLVANACPLPGQLTVRWAPSDSESRGTTKTLSPGQYQIELHSQARDPRLLNVLGHELGHVVVGQMGGDDNEYLAERMFWELLEDTAPGIAGVCEYREAMASLVIPGNLGACARAYGAALEAFVAAYDPAGLPSPEPPAPALFGALSQDCFRRGHQLTKALEYLAGALGSKADLARLTAPIADKSLAGAVALTYGPLLPTLAALPARLNPAGLSAFIPVYEGALGARRPQVFFWDWPRALLGVEPPW